MRRDDDACELDRKLADDFVGEDDTDMGTVAFSIAARGVLLSSLGFLLFVGVDKPAM